LRNDATKIGATTEGASLGRKMMNEFWFGQDRFQDNRTRYQSINQSKYIGLKLKAVRTRDIDLRVLSTDTL
jgi:hypothetical protein